MEIIQLIYLYTIANKEVVLVWCKGHAKIGGNEKADELANLATSLQDVQDIPIPYTDIKAILTKEAEENWQMKYSTTITKKGRFYGTIQPKLPTKPWFHHSKSSRRAITSIIRLRANHTCTPKYLHTIKILPNPTCDCDQKSIADIEHIMLKCPKHNTERRILKEKLKIKELPMNMKNLLENPNKYNHLMEFILTTKIKI